MMNTMGAIIRTEREKRRLTLQEVGAAIGVTTQTISIYEKGEREPRDEVKRRLAEYYRLPISIFYSKLLREKIS